MRDDAREAPRARRVVVERLLERPHVAARSLEQRRGGDVEIDLGAGELGGGLGPPLVVPDAHDAPRARAVARAEPPDRLPQVVRGDAVHRGDGVEGAEELDARGLEGGVDGAHLRERLAAPEARAAQDEIRLGPALGGEVRAQRPRGGAAPGGERAVVVLQALVLRAAVRVAEHDQAERGRGGRAGPGVGAKRLRGRGRAVGSRRARGGLTPPRPASREGRGEPRAGEASGGEARARGRARGTGRDREHPRRGPRSRDAAAGVAAPASFADAKGCHLCADTRESRRSEPAGARALRRVDRSGTRKSRRHPGPRAPLGHFSRAPVGGGEVTGLPPPPSFPRP